MKNAPRTSRCKRRYHHRPVSVHRLQKAASLAKESLKTDIPVKTLVLKYGLLKENELDSILDPYAMTEARTRQTQAKAV